MTRRSTAPRRPWAMTTKESACDTLSRRQPWKTRQEKAIKTIFPEEILEISVFHHRSCRRCRMHVAWHYTPCVVCTKRQTPSWMKFALFFLQLGRELQKLQRHYGNLVLHFETPWDFPNGRQRGNLSLLLQRNNRQLASASNRPRTRGPRKTRKQKKADQGRDTTGLGE